MPPRRSRPASAQPARSRALDGPPAITVEFLRQRVTQMETALRENQAEFKRSVAQHEREVDALQHEYDGLRERLDEVRMEECLTPDELAAARSEHGGAFKLVASSTPAYQQAKALVDEKRSACAAAEKDLESVRAQLSELRQTRVGAQRLRYSSAVEAYMQTHALQQSHLQIRELVKVLETHIAQELDKLSDMTSDAKAMRSAIDAKLITQTRYEKNYARRVNELLERKKQMSFLTEVCQTLFDERAVAVEELRRMQMIARQEDQKYECAFDELTAVEQQNTQKQKENTQRLQQLREQLASARQERLLLEAQNEKARREAANSRVRSARASGVRAGSALADTARPGVDGGSSDAGDRGSVFSSESQTPTVDLNTVEGRISEFENYLNRLSDIAGAETAQDVVGFLESSADDRFRCFSEVRTIDEEMLQLEATKAQLVETADSLGVPSSAEQAERILRMRASREQLTRLKAESLDQEQSAEESDLLFEKVVSHIGVMFAGLGCSVPSLRSTTGSELVSRATAASALALVEQRIEEYLIAYSRRQQQLATRNGVAPTADSRLFEAARPILRRPDLLAKSEQTNAETTMHTVKTLPYSGEVGDDLHTGSGLSAPDDRILSSEELRRIAGRRAHA